MNDGKAKGLVEKPASVGKRSYSAPVLVCFGDFRNITLTLGTRNIADGGGRSSKPV